MGWLKKNRWWFAALVASLFVASLVTYIPIRGHYQGQAQDYQGQAQEWQRQAQEWQRQAQDYQGQAQEWQDFAEDVEWRKNIKETRIPGACNAENDIEAIQATVRLSDGGDSEGVGGLFGDYVLTVGHVVDDVVRWNVTVLTRGRDGTISEAVFVYEVVYKDSELDFVILAPTSESARSVTGVDLAHDAILTREGLREADEAAPVSCRTRLVNFDARTIERIGVGGYGLFSGTDMLATIPRYLDRLVAQGDLSAETAETWRTYYAHQRTGMDLDYTYLTESKAGGHGSSGSPVFIREKDQGSEEEPILRFIGIETGGVLSPLGIETDSGESLAVFIPMTEICPRATEAGIDLCGESGTGD